MGSDKCSSDPTRRFSIRDVTRKTARWQALLGGFHHDSVRGHLSQLRNCDFQHTVDRLRLDVLHVHRIGQAEATLKFAPDALDSAEPFLSGRSGTMLAPAPNAKNAPVG